VSGHLGERLAVRPPELERPVGLACDLVAFFVHRAVMAPTENREVGERGGASARPVANVMALADADSASREAAATVPMLQGAA
jgi:hypothetical protein